MRFGYVCFDVWVCYKAEFVTLGCFGFILDVGFLCFGFKMVITVTCWVVMCLFRDLVYGLIVLLAC